MLAQFWICFSIYQCDMIPSTVDDYYRGLWTVFILLLSNINYYDFTTTCHFLRDVCIEPCLRKHIVKVRMHKPVFEKEQQSLINLLVIKSLILFYQCSITVIFHVWVLCKLNDVVLVTFRVNMARTQTCLGHYKRIHLVSCWPSCVDTFTLLASEPWRRA